MIEFGQPLALLAGLSIGLPILAHLAYQTVTRKHAFSSLRFIRPSSIPRTGRKTPSDIALLLLRILLFLFLTLLLADPYWIDKDSGSTNETESETLIALDLSPSMQGWSGLEEAKLSAKKIIQEADSTDLGFLSFSGSDINILPMGAEKDSLLNEIEGVEHGWSRGNAQVFLDRISDLFSESAKRKKLIILSDFQSADWQSSYRDLAVEGITFDLVKVGQNEKSGGRNDNRSIVEAKAVPVGSDKIRVWVVVRNWMAEKVSAELSLFAGGTTKESQKIDLTPLGSSQAQFILKKGDFSNVTVSLSSDDDFSLDDNRSLWLKAPPPRRFGFWTANDPRESTQEEMDFLKTAVLSAGDTGWNRWVWGQDLADGLRLGSDDSGLELLFALGIGNWFEQESLELNLMKFLDGGGVALLTPGEPFSLTSSIIKQSNLMKFDFSRVVGAASRSNETFRIAALSEENQLSEIFAGNSARDLYLTSFRRFGLLKNWGDDLEIPLFDREGRPLALIRNFESGGRLVFLPFRISPRWTDLPLRNSFLPLLMELVKKGRGESFLRTWPVLEPGESWAGNQVFTAKQPGAVRFEDQWIEVIPSLVESSPETLEKSEIEQLLGGKKNLKSADFPPDNLKEQNQKSLWLWFAIAVAILLIIEMIWSKPQLEPNRESA